MGAAGAVPQHVPVLLERCLELLTPALERPGSVFLDGTLGLGGHTEAVLRRFPDVQVVAFDRDVHAREFAAQRLAQYADRITIVAAEFDRMEEELNDRGMVAVDGILLDLGVSSMQLDQRERGFAYSYDAPLDMRMDPSADLTAAELLATAEVAELTRILREYGEERFALKIARAIVAHREEAPLATSAELVTLLERTVPMRSQRTGGHPAKRTFQALRIAVNDELGCLARALPQVLRLTKLHGRAVVMSYHSLEDRMVKKTFAKAVQADVPPDLPVIPRDARPQFTQVTRGAEVASETEIAANPRAASVRLRAVERIREQP